MIWFELICALAVAVAGPLFMVMIRNDVRLSRLRALYEFDQLFNVSGKTDAGAAAPAPTFEFVRARYTGDIEFPRNIKPESIAKFDLDDEDLAAFIRQLRWWKLKSSTSLLFACAPLMALTAFGMLNLFTSPSDKSPIAAWIRFPASTLVTGSAATPAAAEMLARNASVVGESAFLGALLFVFLLFLRALATFDLSPMTVLRGTLYFLAGVVGAVVLYLGFPDLPAQAVDAYNAVVNNGAAAAGARPVSSIWIVLAFLIGFIPDLAINQMVFQVQKVIKVKTTDDRLAKANPSTPLEVLDGIDVLTRFRLQESNVFEVQNLAVSNPVMLFVESPYGIYQVVDWVAQAQLCVAVGPERFLELQKRSIRTIFDLERAVLSCYSTSQLRRYVAGVLLASPPATSNDVPLTNFAILPRVGDASVGSADALAAAAARMFAEPAISSDGTTASPDPDLTIRHLVLTMVDDLHVCRLRQVWQQIMVQIDGERIEHHDSKRLWDTQWPPPLPTDQTGQPDGQKVQGPPSQ